MKITNVELQNTGGGCMVLYIEVEGKNFKTIGLNDECICLYLDTLEEIEVGEYNECDYIDMLSDEDPWEVLRETIGQANGQAVKELYEKKYLEPTR